MAPQTDDSGALSLEQMEDIAGSAAALFGTSSDNEIDVDELDTEEEEVEEVEDLEDEVDDEDVDEEDDPSNLEEDLDDEDLEDLDDEEEDEEESEDEEDEEDDEEEDEEPELHTVKVNGEEFQVTTEDLVAGYQRNADYTQGKQRLAEIYKRMEDWYEERANDPEGWVAEISYTTEDPAQTLSGAILRSGNATVLLGQTLRHLVESGEIAEELVEALNLQHVAEQAKDENLHHEVKSLREELRTRDQRAQQAAQEQQQMQQVQIDLQRQWNSVKDMSGWEFNSPQEEEAARNGLMKYALDRGIPYLEDAYRSYAFDNGAPTQQKKSKKKANTKKAVQKRKSSAMSRKPTGGGPKGKSKKPASGDDVVANAANDALAELGLDLD